MKIDVPVYDEDGTVKFNASLSEGELQAVLQFGLNLAIASGISNTLGVHIDDDEDTDYEPSELN